MYEDDWPKQLGWLFVHNFVKQMQYIANNFLFVNYVERNWQILLYKVKLIY